MSSNEWRDYYNIIYIESPEKITARRKLYQALQGRYTISGTELRQRIFDRGLKAMAEEEENVPQRELSLFLSVQESEMDDKIIAALAKRYEKYGEEKFLEWCDENGWNRDEYVVSVVVSNKLLFAPSKKEVMIMWLREYLGDSEIPTSEIRIAAEKNGIITNDKDWSYMKILAGEEGWSKMAPRGYWRSTGKLES